MSEAYALHSTPDGKQGVGGASDGASQTLGLVSGAELLRRSDGANADADANGAAAKGGRGARGRAYRRFGPAYGCAAAGLVAILAAASRLGKGGSGGGGDGGGGGRPSTRHGSPNFYRMPENEENDDNDKDDKDDKDGPWPRVAWLMSFPNSGTSYTLRMTQWSSNVTAASNYGDECDVNPETGLNYPLLPSDSPGGPHVKFATKHRFPADNYVLTKTHCGGRCTHCGPDEYVETAESFRVSCLSGNRYVERGTTEEGGEHKIKKTDKRGRVEEHDVELIHGQRYDPSLVKRAVHVIRDPFDNVVARFHLDYGKHRKDEEFAARYSYDPRGFRKWCKDIDDEHLPAERKSRFIDADLIPLFEKVPCHGDFYRYVQWHNLAVATTAKMDLPTYVLHYDEYATDFERTKNDLMGFLRLEIVGEVPEFVAGKTYRDDYYKREEREAALQLMRMVAQPEAWSLMERYNYV